MCGIAGFCCYNGDYVSNKDKWMGILSAMGNAVKRRGPDDRGEFLSSFCAMSHTRLSIIDLETGRQPIVKTIGGRQYAIVYNGELYNMKELKNDLLGEGFSFDTKSDTEVILNGFACYGAGFVQKMNGVFAFAVWDSEGLYLFRDRAGIKPLFYTIRNDTLIFGSEIKALLAYPGIKPVVDKEGLCEIFALGPARTAGKGVFKDIWDILPGYYAVYNKNGFKSYKYWDIVSMPHTDSYAETLEKAGFLITDAIKRQMVSDVPICSFLSGGVDSSVVTAVAAAEYKKQGKQLSTFSFDFEGNDIHFKSNSFQPDRDRPWVDKMAAFCETKHMYLECDTESMTELLFEAVDAKDLPGMADVDSSLMYFCGRVKEFNKVALTGECADEIFGGYPWFHSKEAFECAAFPWSRDMGNRKVLLSDDFLSELDIDEYSSRRYAETIAATPALEGESALERRRREIAYLNLKWFMSTLIDRMDRVSMYSGLEARVPFADHRIIEYVWNVPWDIKCKDGMVKHLLRQSVKGLLPDEVLFRKKSPYPKSYNPAYEKKLAEMLMDVLHDSSSPVRDFLDMEKVKRFVSGPQDYGKPWFGQLMAGPQMLAYMLQINYWIKKYSIDIAM